MVGCPTIEPLQWIALSWSTSVQKANPQKAGPLHNAPTGQPLQLAPTSRTTIVLQKLASVRLHAEQKERSAKLLNQADSCMKAANCLWQSCWPHLKGLPLTFPLYLILSCLLYLSVSFFLFSHTLPSLSRHCFLRTQILRCGFWSAFFCSVHHIPDQVTWLFFVVSDTLNSKTFCTKPCSLT